MVQLSALAERVSATIRIAQERARHLDSELEPGRGQDPDEMEARAERIAAEEAELIAAVRHRSRDARGRTRTTRRA